VVTVAAGAARVTLPQVATHAAFPGMCPVPGGLLRVWRDAPEHTGGADGRLLASILDPLTLRSGAPWLLVDAARDVRDPSVAADPAGAVWLTWFDYATASSPQCVSWAAQSTDGGQTFGVPEQIDPTAPMLAVCAPVVPLPGGELLAVVYGRRTATATRDSCYAYRRSVDGVWRYAATIADGPAAGRDYQEPTAILLRNGAVLAAFRYGSTDRIGVAASWDGGVTWSAPTPKFAGTGRPSLLERSTGPTVCVYRALGSPAPAKMRVSADRGGTWGAEQHLADAPAQTTYAALVETGPGLITAALGIESNVTTSRILGLHLLDT
jgi:hypothetical protein